MSEALRKLEIKNRPEFIKFVDSFAKISDSFIADVQADQISVITTSPDSTLIVYGQYKCNATYCTSLNIPDSKKLVRVLDTISSEQIEFILNSNNLEYKDKSVRFKYHLFEDGFLAKPALSIKKIEQFEYDIVFNLTKAQIQSLVKGSTFTTETNKLYIYTDGTSLIGELTDKIRHNSDSYSLKLGDVDFTLSPIAVNFENIRLLTLFNDNIVVRINSKLGVLAVECDTDSIKLTYIITSYTQ